MSYKAVKEYNQILFPTTLLEFMANFNTHLSGGFFVSAITAIIGYKAEILDHEQLLLCTAIGTLGGLLPDIDSTNSTPVKIAFNLSSLILAFSLVIFWKHSLPLIPMIATWMVALFVIRFLIFKVFMKMTVHRGVIHSIPYMAMLAMILVYVNYYFLHTPVIASWLYGLFLFIGSMVHLILDEIYSVNLMNMTVKRSFGTALKIYKQKNGLYFLLVYSILAYLIYYAPPFTEFWQRLTDPVTWLFLKGELL